MESNRIKINDQILIKALRILSQDIQSDDGIANVVIAEAANRIEELFNKLDQQINELTQYGIADLERFQKQQEYKKSN